MAAWDEPPRRERNPWPWLAVLFCVLAFAAALGAHTLWADVLGAIRQLMEGAGSS